MCTGSYTTELLRSAVSKPSMHWPAFRQQYIVEVWITAVLLQSASLKVSIYLVLLLVILFFWYDNILNGDRSTCAVVVLVVSGRLVRMTKFTSHRLYKP